MNFPTGRVILAAGIVSLVVCLGGCEQAGKKQVRARVPEPAVNQALTQTLPIDAGRLSRIPMLAPPPRAGVQVLGDAVEAAWEAGEGAARAGRAAEARREYERALGWLEASGIPAQSDARLAQLAQRLSARLRAAEQAARAAEGEGAEQNPVAAPIDEIADVELPADPRLKEKAELGLRELPHDLPLTVNDHVLKYLNFFQTPRGRRIVETGLQRAGRYREMISRILREEGLPQDLIYLAQAESAFKPLAVSRAGARGIWQFMLFRGREYGLKRTWWVDDRHDPEMATRAAAKHLRDLYADFHDWYLALAAYNSGPGNVSRGIARTGYADFWELYRRNVLPRETKNYVPIILALTIVAKDAARYGVEAAADEPVRSEPVKLDHAVDLRLVAETLDVSVETLRGLNPRLLRMATPAPKGSGQAPNESGPAPAGFELRVQEGTGERLRAGLAQIPPEKWLSWRIHRIAEGEGLAGMARKYGVTVSGILDANRLDAATILPVGRELIVPAAARPATGEWGRLVRYRVRSGDTLGLIAEQFAVSVADLKKWNGIRGDTVARGARLKVYPGGRLAAQTPGPPRRAKASPLAVKKGQPREPARAPIESRRAAGGGTAGPATGGKTLHTVQAGETLWEIARAYQTTVEAIRRANQFIAARPIRAGDQLTILPPHQAEFGLSP